MTDPARFADAGGVAWDFCDISVPCLGVAVTQVRPTLLSRLRGRLGQQLFGQIPADRYAEMFPERGQRPPPFVVRIDGPPAAPMLIVRLFGRAAELCGVVGEALEAVTGQGLIVPGRMTPLIAVGEVSIVHHSHVPIRNDVNEIVLRFVTPTCLGHDQFVPNSFLYHVATRIDRLALWQDGQPPLSQPDQIDFLTNSTMERRSWTRIAHRQDGRQVPMEGYVGEMRLKGELATIMPFLSLCEVCHVGRHTTFGMGRSEIVPTYGSYT